MSLSLSSFRAKFIQFHESRLWRVQQQQQMSYIPNALTECNVIIVQSLVISVCTHDRSREKEQKRIHKRIEMAATARDINNAHRIAFNEAKYPTIKRERDSEWQSVIVYFVRMERTTERRLSGLAETSVMHSHSGVFIVCTRSERNCQIGLKLETACVRTT